MRVQVLLKAVRAILTGAAGTWAQCRLWLWTTGLQGASEQGQGQHRDGRPPVAGRPAARARALGFLRTGRLLP